MQWLLKTDGTPPPLFFDAILFLSQALGLGTLFKPLLQDLQPHNIVESLWHNLPSAVWL